MGGFNISTTYLNQKKKVPIYPNLEDRMRIVEKEQRQKTLKITTEDRRAKAFSLIKDDCKNIPFWIPEPIEFKDFNLQRVIDRFNGCKTIEETIILTKTLELEHEREYESEYQRHQDLFDSTLLKHYKEHRENPEYRPLEYVKPTCCFNHYFSLTSKRDSPSDLLPIFDYELYLVHKLDTRKFITFLASRGLGKTHIIVVRYANWRVLRSNEWDNQDILLTTGLTQQNSTELLNKINNMYIDAFPNSLDLDFVGTEMFIDKTRFIAFPSENIKKMRLYDRVAAVLVDEADFFSLKDQQRLQEAIFGYVIKSRPTIVFFSTPDKPTGFLVNARKKWLEAQKNNNNNNNNNSEE